jgi:hypothetical protein
MPPLLSRGTAPACTGRSQRSGCAFASMSLWALAWSDRRWCVRVDSEPMVGGLSIIGISDRQPRVPILDLPRPRSRPVRQSGYQQPRLALSSTDKDRRHRIHAILRILGNISSHGDRIECLQPTADGINGRDRYSRPYQRPTMLLVLSRGQGVRARTPSASLPTRATSLRTSPAETTTRCPMR